MGNQLGCFGGGHARSQQKKKQKHQNSGLRKRGDWENGVIEQQALAMALQQQHKAQMRFERNNMTPGRDPFIQPPRKSYAGRSLTAENKMDLKRSNSSRFRRIDDLIVDPNQLVNGIKDGVVRGDIETRHFVLVHGGGLGAWCWYKSIALLEEAGLIATAIDLKGSGIDSTDPNQINSMAVYVKPLVDFMEHLGSEEKVILVAHNIGGACISYAMECFPNKISKAIFVAASMISNGQRAFDVFKRQEKTDDDLMPKAQIFLYGNGTSSAPTAVELDRALVRDLFFNVSPAKDVALAMVSMRPVPFAPAMENITLTPEKYGSVRRFYVRTAQDQAFSPDLQQKLIEQNPPEQVFTMKTGDHSPFFSKPQSLHRLFVEIAMIPAKN